MLANCFKKCDAQCVKLCTSEGLGSNRSAQGLAYSNTASGPNLGANALEVHMLQRRIQRWARDSVGHAFVWDTEGYTSDFR